MRIASDTVQHWIDDHIDTTNSTLYLEGAVDESMLSTVVKGLQLFSGKDCNILLCSGGGDVVYGLAIYDLLANYGGKITITVIGQAESMAAIVLQGATRRIMSKHSHLMIHQGEIEAPEGHVKNIKAFIGLSDKQDEICDRILLDRIQIKHSDYSWTKFRRTNEFDTYLTAEKAKYWGLVDEVI